MSNKPTWTELAEVRAPYDGRIPGRSFGDVTCTIERRGDRIRVTLLEQRGSAQGRHDEIHEESKVVAIDTDLDAAVRIASSRAQQAELHRSHTVQALSQAHAEAVDELDRLEEGA